MHINELDGIILLLIMISSMIGVLRGFVKEVLQLISLVLAIFIAFFFRKYLVFLFTFISSDFIKEVIAGILIFIVMFITGSIIVYLICQTIKMQGFGKFIDKLLGLSYGCARGVFILMLAVMLLSKNHTITSQSWWQKSVLLKKIQGLSGNFSKAIPVAWQETINQITD